MVNTAGVLLTQKAALVWADALEDHTPWMNKTIGGDGRYSFTADWVLNYLCADGLVTCGVRPLVSEAGFMSIS